MGASPRSVKQTRSTRGEGPSQPSLLDRRYRQRLEAGPGGSWAFAGQAANVKIKAPTTADGNRGHQIR